MLASARPSAAERGLDLNGRLVLTEAQSLRGLPMLPLPLRVELLALRLRLHLASPSLVLPATFFPRCVLLTLLGLHLLVTPSSQTLAMSLKFCFVFGCTDVRLQFAGAGFCVLNASSNHLLQCLEVCTLDTRWEWVLSIAATPCCPCL